MMVDAERPNQPTGSGAEYFNAQAQRWETLYRSKAAFRDRLALFTGQLRRRAPAGSAILDVGCGPGVMTLAFADMGYKVVGVDKAPNMVGCAESARRHRRIGHAHFAVMDGTVLSFPAESFDAVVCSSLLEYVERDQDFLAELVRVLRPGGALLISAPHRASLLGRAEDATARISRLQRMEGRGYLSYLRRRYDTRELLKLMRGLSLDSFECTYFEVPVLGRIGVPLSRVKRIGLMLLVGAKKHGGPIAAQPEPSPPERMGRTRAISRKNLWDAMPATVRNWAGHVLRLADASYVLGRQFRQCAQFVDQAQWWPAERTREYQLARLREMCALAYEKTSFYRESFDAAGFHPNDLNSLDDFAAVPPIDKETLLGNLDRMCTVSPRSPGVDYVSTGGTSGNPLGFYIGVDRSAIEYAYLAAGWRRAGYELTMAQCVLRGKVIEPDRNGLLHEYDPLFRRHYYSNFHMDDDSMRRYLEHIETVGPCYLQVYPSAATVLARYVERSGRKAPGNIRGILAGSENVYDQDRALVERVFGVRFLGWYGHSEKLVMAVECEHSTRYHVWPTYGYFELLDDEGRPITEPGQRGEIVGTGFINKVVPFIRYRTGDHATYVADRCDKCGREHPIIERIRGHRVQEVLVASDGALISWTALNMHDDTFDRVRQFQFAQEEAGVAILRIVPGAGFDDEDLDRIRRNIERKLGGRIEFEVVLVESLPLTSAGKSIYVDQKIEGLSEGVKGIAIT